MTLPILDWQTLQQSAELARLGALHEQAIDLYSQALAQPEVTWEQKCAMTLERADCRRMLGDAATMDLELTALADQAAARGDEAARSRLLAMLTFTLRSSGDLGRAMQVGRDALAAAEQVGQPELKAEALLASGLILQEQGEYGAAQDCLDAAQSLISQDDRLGQIKIHFLKMLLLRRSGRHQESIQLSIHGQQLARAISNRDWEGFFLNGQAASTNDLSLKQSIYERALSAFEASGNRLYQAVVLMNNSSILIDLGLYQRALETAQQALDMTRSMHQDVFSVYCLQFLSMAYFSNGDLNAAGTYASQGLHLAQKIGHNIMKFVMRSFQGLICLLKEQPKPALEAFQAADAISWQRHPLTTANVLAYQANAYRLAGDLPAANQITDQVVKLIDENINESNRDLFIEEICWWCYRAQATETGEGLTAQAWHILDLGLKATFEPIETLSDAGLRRGYLHRVHFRRLLIMEWLRYAPECGVEETEMSAFAARVQKPGRLDEVFRRLLSVGVRLNSQRDPDLLPGVIVEEISELIGAERIALELYDHDGNRHSAGILLPRPPFPAMSGMVQTPTDPKEFLDEIKPWLDEAANIRQGILREVNPQGPLTDQRSILVSPLLNQDRLAGLIYCDLTGCFGRFEPEDLDLLGVLSNQSAVAIENANWSTTLENKVKERTADLERRTAELTIINRVQEGVVRQLDFQAVIDLVGEEIMRVFPPPEQSAHLYSVFIALYDSQNNMIQFPYWTDAVGNRFHQPAVEFGEGLTSEVIRSRQPLVLGSWEENLDHGAIIFDDGLPDEFAQSWLGVPMLFGDRVTGVICVQDPRQNHYAESDVTLLSTLAASLGAALENARLFAETQRLLKETELRNAELAILNRISQAMSSKLDVDAIIHTVGDQVRDSFNSPIVNIALYDPANNLIHLPYSYDRMPVISPPFPYGPGLTSRVIDTRQPLVLGTFEEIFGEGAILTPNAPDDELMPQSYLGVPIIVGDRVIGVIDVQSYQPDEYDESHVRLLTTLASSMGVALENARLYSDADQRAGQMATLAEAGREISASHDLTAIMENITRRAHQVCRARTTVLRLAEPDGQAYRAVVALGMYAEQFKSEVIKPGEGITGAIIVSHIPEIIPDPLQDPRTKHVQGTPEKEEQPETMMVAPLVVRDQTVGVLTLYRWTSEGQFTAVDLDFLSGLARQAAIAIENVHLLEEAQESRRHMADIIEFLPDATLVVDHEGTVIAWNRAIEEMTGVKAADMLGKGNYEYALPFYGERRPILIDLVLYLDEEVERKYANIKRQGSILEGEVVVPLLQGQPAYLYATASPLCNSKGEIIGAIEAIRDMSERKRAEQELQQAKADAENARQQAEAATQAKSAFLATMSHEIRTPMNAIIGMSGLLLNTSLDNQQQEFAEIIRTSGDTLLAIINDILDFSKIEAGKLGLEYTAFDLRECLESAIDMVAAPAAEKKLELALDMEPDLPSTIVSDVTRLRQVLINLLNNAVKFTSHGEVVLTASLEKNQPDPEYAYLHFAVRDTGIGIPPERHDRLFLSFSQVDDSTSRRYGGTGLGLAISRRLVEMMGGSIWVESQVGVGSDFHFTIQAEPSQLDVRTCYRGEQPALAGRRLLVVDDNPTNRRIICLQAQDWGMIANETGSPIEALSWIRRGDPFDLAILDLRMPDMDGLALGQEVRKLRDGKSLPLVILSSVGEREAGTDRVDWAAYLTKPVKQSQLFNVLGNIFGQIEEQPAAEPIPQHSRADPQMAARFPLEILLVEDNTFNQKLATHLLGQMGYRADLAANGLEAIQSVERQHYDVVLMDVQMPEMDGLEATRRICARWPRERRPQIIAMTANAMQGDREMCLQAGMDDYISKPIRIPDLSAALERAAGQKNDIGNDHE